MLASTLPLKGRVAPIVDIALWPGRNNRSVLRIAAFSLSSLLKLIIIFNYLNEKDYLGIYSRIPAAANDGESMFFRLRGRAVARINIRTTPQSGGE